MLELLRVYILYDNTTLENVVLTTPIICRTVPIRSVFKSREIVFNVFSQLNKSD